MNLLLLYPRKETEIIIPSKVYDYMRSGIQILALIPTNGVCADLLKKNKMGIIINPKDIVKTKNIISNELKRHLEGENNRIKEIRNIEKYERKNIIKKLLKIINNLE
jgi:glycosyltransferase involved in cell wall biosynthesis